MVPRWLVPALAAAVVVFCVVQDRVTAAGARRYVALQRDALASGTPGPVLDEVMAPAIRRSVRLGLVSGGAAGALTLGASLLARRTRRE
jgi:hypothetical protein